MGKKALRILLKIILRLVLLALVLSAAYVAYMFMTYHRLPDTSEQHSDNTADDCCGVVVIKAAGTAALGG